MGKVAGISTRAQASPRNRRGPFWLSATRWNAVGVVASHTIAPSRNSRSTTIASRSTSTMGIAAWRPDVTNTALASSGRSAASASARAASIRASAADVSTSRASNSCRPSDSSDFTRSRCHVGSRFSGPGARNNDTQATVLTSASSSIRASGVAGLGGPFVFAPVSTIQRRPPARKGRRARGAGRRQGHDGQRDIRMASGGGSTTPGRAPRPAARSPVPRTGASHPGPGQVPWCSGGAAVPGGSGPRPCRRGNRR